MTARADKDPYLLGTGDEELERLARQHDVWRATTKGLYDEAGFGAGQTLLDLGCGPGLTSLELAARVGPDGRVIAVDNSRRFLDVLDDYCTGHGITQVHTRHADAHALKLDDASLHGVFVRWLLCFLPNVPELLAALATALRPGGRIAIMDYFHYLAISAFPESDVFDRVFRAVHRSFAESGGDLDIGDKLPAMLEDAGLSVVHIEPIIDTARPGSAVWQWVRAFQKSYLPQLVEKGYLTQDDVDANDAYWRARAEDPASFFLSPPMLGVVAQKPG